MLLKMRLPLEEVFQPCEFEKSLILFYGLICLTVMLLEAGSDDSLASSTITFRSEQMSKVLTFC
jgi:hypothetical protein